jgi:hypothetical protein
MSWAVVITGTAILLQVSPAYGGTELTTNVVGVTGPAEEECQKALDTPATAVESLPLGDSRDLNLNEQGLSREGSVDQAPTPRPPSIQPEPERSCIDHPGVRYKRALFRLLAEVARAAAYQ